MFYWSLCYVHFCLLGAIQSDSTSLQDLRFKSSSLCSYSSWEVWLFKSEVQELPNQQLTVSTANAEHSYTLKTTHLTFSFEIPNQYRKTFRNVYNCFANYVRCQVIIKFLCQIIFLNFKLWVSPNWKNTIQCRFFTQTKTPAFCFMSPVTWNPEITPYIWFQWHTCTMKHSSVQD